ncbi:DUF4253 domain-containing protein [Actinoplanes sp. CA-252034]|uniref:DUF4253 domain-containing protein n=1 Tax=Actinoplanes sp. CA-252034 TaxID=3239906 RepID=UPI003D9948EF
MSSPARLGKDDRIVLGRSEIADAMRGTALAGLPVHEWVEGTLIVSGVDADDNADLLKAWRAAYALLPRTGRWPVLVADEDVNYELEPSPFDARVEAELVALDQAARTVDPWPFFQEGDDGPPEVELSFYTGGLHGVDVTADVLPTVSQNAGTQQILRAAYDHVLADPRLTAKVLEGARHLVNTEYWYQPNAASLLLAPTPSPWLAVAPLGFYGALGHDAELAAVLRQWHERWDVRPVAFWGTMMQFEVHRKPLPGDDAWTAARQVLALSPNIDVLQWELAVAVAAGDTWFVHHRP